MLIMGTWFGKFTVLCTTIWARGQVNLLFVAQAIWLFMPNVCSGKGVWVENGIQDHELCNSNNVQVGGGTHVAY